MSTLDWIGKQAVVNQHRDVPYRLINCDKSKSLGDQDAGNRLAQGDNLEALKERIPAENLRNAKGAVVGVRFTVMLPKG